MYNPDENSRITLITKLSRVNKNEFKFNWLASSNNEKDEDIFITFIYMFFSTVMRELIVGLRENKPVNNNELLNEALDRFKEENKLNDYELEIVDRVLVKLIQSFMREIDDYSNISSIFDDDDDIINPDDE